MAIEYFDNLKYGHKNKEKGLHDNKIRFMKLPN